MIERQFINQKLKEFQIQEQIGRIFARTGFSHIEIRRTPLGENVIVYTTRPGIVVGKKGENIKKLTALLKNKYKLENPQLEIGELEAPMLDVDYVADRVASSLERFGQKRFKSIGYKLLQNIMDAGAIGAEIILSGKIPSTRARSWRFSAGYLKKSGDINQSKVLKKSLNFTNKMGTVGIAVSILTSDIMLEKEMLAIKPEYLEPQLEETDFKELNAEKTVEVSEVEGVDVIEVKEDKTTKKVVKKVAKEAPKEEAPKEEVKEVKVKPKSDPKQVEELRNKLNTLNTEKEQWFNKKEELNTQIKALVKTLKENSSEVDVEKKKEKEIKTNRDKFNKIFLTNLKKSKELVAERRTIQEKFGRNTNPANIKEKIEKLEYSIETEVLSINKEKKIMSQIKDLRKVIAEAPNLTDFKTQMDEISKELTAAKEEADKYHKELRELTKINRDKFKDYIENSKKVNKLKKQQRVAFKKFIGLKKEYSELSAKLKEIAPRAIKQHRPQRSNHHRPKRNNNQRRTHTPDIKHLQESFIDTAKLIEERVRDVEQKIKQKKKLTTKDIIAMQGSKE